MQKRGLFILVAATAILVVIAAIAALTGNRAVTRGAATERVFPALAGKIGDIASLALSRPDLKATFKRDGDRWLVAEKGNYPASSAKVGQAILAIADLSSIEPKTSKPDLYSRLEVEDPGKGKSTLATLKDKSGATLAELIVGKQRPDRAGASGNDAVYIRKPGEAQAWLARGSLDLSGDLASWLDRRILNISEKRLASVTVTQPDGAKLTISRAAADGKFAVESPPANAKFKSDAATAEPATALETLDFNDVRPASEQAIPDSGSFSAVYTTFDGLTLTVRLVDRDGIAWISLAAAGTEQTQAEAKKLNDTLTGWSFSLPTFKAGLMKTKIADLLEPPAPAAPPKS